MFNVVLVCLDLSFRSNDFGGCWIVHGSRCAIRTDKCGKIAWECVGLSQCLGQNFSRVVQAEQEPQELFAQLCRAQGESYCYIW